MQTEEPAEEGLTPKQCFTNELAEISFQELQKYFAKGILIKVADQLDIIDVALQIHADNTSQIQKWMDDQDIERVHDDHAQFWVNNRSVLKAVTVAPWVLVQNLTE